LKQHQNGKTHDIVSEFQVHEHSSHGKTKKTLKIQCQSRLGGRQRILAIQAFTRPHHFLKNKSSNHNPTIQWHIEAATAYEMAQKRSRFGEATLHPTGDIALPCRLLELKGTNPQLQLNKKETAIMQAEHGTTFTTWSFFLFSVFA
jgi:hypothetical protein